MFDIWSEKLRGRGMPEYEAGNIRVNTNLNNGECCYIFCSSNNIWYPNTQQAYVESIISRDRYEWTNFQLSNAAKQIFVRDSRIKIGMRRFIIRRIFGSFIRVLTQC